MDINSLDSSADNATGKDMIPKPKPTTPIPFVLFGEWSGGYFMVVTTPITIHEPGNVETHHEISAVFNLTGKYAPFKMPRSGDSLGLKLRSGKNGELFKFEGPTAPNLPDPGFSLDGGIQGSSFYGRLKGSIANVGHVDETVVARDADPDIDNLYDFSCSQRRQNSAFVLGTAGIMGAGIAAAARWRKNKKRRA